MSAQLAHSFRGVSLAYYDQTLASHSLDKDYLYRSYSMSVIQRNKMIATPLVAITYDLQTQLGVSQMSESREAFFPKKGLEAALLLGINVEASLLPDWWWVYIGGSVGPQFVSIAPARQKEGFIFSDSAYLGSRFFFGKGRQLDVRAGIRHQSNAGLSEPNGGIDAFFIKVGIMREM